MLTDTGYLKAGALYRLLKDSGIQRIYLTPYASSRETAESLRTYLHIDTVTYTPDTSGEGLLYEKVLLRSASPITPALAATEELPSA